MSVVTENKIMDFLTDFSHPGGPYFPSRPLRHLALKMQNDLFPKRPARRTRKLVHSFFRLLHPFYWAESLSFYALDYTKRILLYIKAKTLDRILEAINERMQIAFIDKE